MYTSRMRFYSSTILAFLDKVRQSARRIFEAELHIPLRRSRFLYKGYMRPLELMVFEHPTILGSYEPERFMLGLNRRLMVLAKWDVIENVIRHEIAHVMTSIDYPHADVAAHGLEFRDVCRRYAWGPEVWGSTANLDEANASSGDVASDEIIDKIKKLLRLAESHNVHEAQAATMKANDLLRKHHLNGVPREHDDEFVVDSVLSGPKKTIKMRAIADILDTFYVRSILSCGKGITHVEVTGERTHVDIARYVAQYLDRELEVLWREARRTHEELKGAIDKNSFFIGVSKGYLEKHRAMQSTLHSSESRALVIIERALDQQVQIAYHRLGRASSEARMSRRGNDVGLSTGRRLSIRQGLGQRTGSRLLSWEK